jgi:hypothetical protein
VRQVWVLLYATTPPCYVQRPLVACGPAQAACSGQQQRWERCSQLHVHTCMGCLVGGLAAVQSASMQHRMFPCVLLPAAWCGWGPAGGGCAAQVAACWWGVVRTTPARSGCQAGWLAQLRALMGGTAATDCHMAAPKCGGGPVGSTRLLAWKPGCEAAPHQPACMQGMGRSGCVLPGRVSQLVAALRGYRRRAARYM